MTAEQAGLRLDVVLAAFDPVGSRAAAAELIKCGHVTLNGAAVKKRAIVDPGDRVEIALTEVVAGDEPHESAVEFTIIHRDDALLVVDKPAGLVVHPAPGNRSGTLSQALAGIAGGGDPERPGIVHRLDKDTSGLLVVARNDATLRALQRAIGERAVERRYTALVYGRPRSTAGTIDAPLGRSRSDPEVIAIRGGSGRASVTHFETIEEIGPRTLLSVRLESGRTHQIRVHLASIGLPVCGDRKYGRADDLGLTRQFLHAGDLSFEHPDSGERLSFHAPLPPELQRALESARAER